MYKLKFFGGDLNSFGLNKNNYKLIAGEYREHLLSINSKTNCYVEVATIEQIEEYFCNFLDAKDKEKPLFGKVIGIKDVFFGFGEKLRTPTCCSKMQFYSQSNNSFVNKTIVEAGGFANAITACDEFACGSSGSESYRKNVVSFIDENTLAGGSSSGASVNAAATTYVDLGTDTGGSCRLPAEINGITGFKPTYGFISREGMVEYAASLDTVGLMSYKPSNITEVLRTLAHPDCGDWNTFFPPRHHQPKEKPFVLIKGFEDHYIEEDYTLATLIRELEKFLQKGITVQTLPLKASEIAACYSVLSAAEMFSSLRRFDFKMRGKNEDRNLMRDFLKCKIMTGASVTTGNGLYHNAAKFRRVIADIMLPLLQDSFVIIPNIIAQHNVELNEARLLLANLVGTPSVNTPLFVEQEMFVTVGINGYFGEDFQILEIAQQIYEKNSNLKNYYQQILKEFIKR